MTGAGVGIGKVWRRFGWRVGGDEICSILCTLRLCLRRSVSTAVYKRAGIVSKGDVFHLWQAKEGCPPIFASFLTSSRVGLRPSWASANARSHSLSSWRSFSAWAECGSEDGGIVSTGLSECGVEDSQRRRRGASDRDVVQTKGKGRCGQLPRPEANLRVGR